MYILAEAIEDVTELDPYQRKLHQLLHLARGTTDLIGILRRLRLLSSQNVPAVKLQDLLFRLLFANDLSRLLDDLLPCLLQSESVKLLVISQLGCSDHFLHISSDEVDRLLFGVCRIQNH